MYRDDTEALRQQLFALEQKLRLERRRREDAEARALSALSAPPAQLLRTATVTAVGGFLGGMVLALSLGLYGPGGAVHPDHEPDRREVALGSGPLTLTGETGPGPLRWRPETCRSRFHWQVLRELVRVRGLAEPLVGDFWAGPEELRMLRPDPGGTRRQ
jgi:hypothetical protein